MITLGINAAFHDSAATIVVDGRVVAAAEEERFTRIKHAKRPVPFSAWELPFHAIDFCLAQAGVRLVDCDHVAYSYDPRRFLRDRRIGDTIELPLVPSAANAAEWENPWDPLFAAFIVNAPGQLADGAPHHLKQRFAGARADGPYRFHFLDHHLSHQASAFLASPYERCAVMTIDGRGEDATTSYGVYREDRYEALGEVRMPHSLGLLYERITGYLGFLHSSDEYKVMALAALGTPRFASRLRELVEVGHDGRYRIAPFDPVQLFGPARERGAELTQAHFDLTASLQLVLEEAVLRLANWLADASGERRLAMAGGVALNCVMNARLRDAGTFDEIWVQPAAGDAGTALGAALWIDAQARLGGFDAARGGSVAGRSVVGEAFGAESPLPHALVPEEAGAVRLAPRRWTMTHAYLGPEASDDEIEAFLRWAKLGHRKVEDPAVAAAELLAEGRVIGWVQGRMEFGPRALGARSILASPIDPEMQQRINELKDREDFRPVAPALPIECLAQWFVPAEANGGASPFMLFVYDTIEAQAARIPSACHADLTARVQTVDAATNPVFHRLLVEFGMRTGVPVLVNTSFNVRGEPVVCTPKDAIDAFHSTPIDALVLGRYVLEKPR